MNHTLTDIPNLLVGHATDLDAATGCTVILCPEGATAGVDVRGGGPGTREVALLDPLRAVQQVHAIMLSGGSAFGLAAADGVVRWLEERGHGYETTAARVPIVPSAILYDLGLGSVTVRPTADMGYAACEAASSGPVTEGSVGAGTGATVGKLLGFAQATKSGLGTASRRLDGFTVAALTAVNAIGDVVDPSTGEIVAGARRPEGGWANSMALLESRLGQMVADSRRQLGMGQNTTLAVVATDAPLDKVSCTKVAQMAHNGLARAIRPVHTAFDGDTVFALSSPSSGPSGAGTVLGLREASLLGAVAAEVLAEAVLRAARSAMGLHGLPSMGEI